MKILDLNTSIFPLSTAFHQCPLFIDCTSDISSVVLKLADTSSISRADCVHLFPTLLSVITQFEVGKAVYMAMVGAFTHHGIRPILQIRHCFELVRTFTSTSLHSAPPPLHSYSSVVV